jgi:hypothetical protein
MTKNHTIALFDAWYPQFPCLHTFTHSYIHSYRLSLLFPLTIIYRILCSMNKPTTTTTTHRCHDGHHHAGHNGVPGTIVRHERSASADQDFHDMEMSIMQDGGVEHSNDHASAVLHPKTSKTKTTATTTATTKQARHCHYKKKPGTRTILLTCLALVTLYHLSTVAQEVWTWDPTRICGQWSNDRTFQEPTRAGAPSMNQTSGTTNKTKSTTTRPQKFSHTDFFVAQPPLTSTSTRSQQLPRTVYFTGTPWMQRPRTTNHTSSSTRVYYPIKLLPLTMARTNETNTTTHDDDDNADGDWDNDATRLYPVMDSQDTSMERRIWPTHELDPHCEPMADWQTTFYPVCNEMHATNMADSFIHDDLQLLSKKGFWRHAWQMDKEAKQNITTVLKTLKCVDTTILAEQH